MNPLQRLGSAARRLFGRQPAQQSNQVDAPWELKRLLHSMPRFGRGSYDGGEAGSRRWSSRRQTAGSADEDLDADTLDRLRLRSRDRFRNDGMARAAIDSLSDQVVGAGLRPRLRLDAKILGIQPEQATDLQRQAQSIWDEWCETADIRGVSHFDFLQGLIFGSAMVSGDVVVRPVFYDDPRIPHRLSLRVEVIEGDRLDNPQGRENDPRIRNGVEINSATGAPIAYWIADSHPGDLQVGQVRRRRISAHSTIGRPNVLHVFAPSRPGQNRGEPVLAPVLDTFKDCEDYIDAAVMRQYVAACFAAFVTRPNPNQSAMYRATDDTRGGGTGERQEEMNPGQILYQAPGEQVSFSTPPQDTTFESFMTFVGRRLAAATGQPYEVVAKDFSKTNFSSARAALAEAIRGYRRRRSWFARQCLTPLYRLVLEEAWSAGLIELGSAERPLLRTLSNGRVWIDPEWVTPEWIPIGGTGWIDPKADAAADQVLLAMGVTTRDRIVAERTGGDWEADVAPQWQRESELVGRGNAGQDSGASNPEQQDPDGEAQDQPAGEADRGDGGDDPEPDPEGEDGGDGSTDGDGGEEPEQA